MEDVRESTGLVFNPIMVAGNALLFNCMRVDQDGPDINHFTSAFVPDNILW